MINKVVYIGYQPLTEKVKEDFYFKNLKEKGIEIEYWDLSGLYFKGVLNDELKDDFIVKVNSYILFEDCLKRQSVTQTLFILLFTFEYRVLKLHRILSKFKCKTSFFARGALPSSYGSSENKVKILIIKLRKVFDFKLLKVYVRNKQAFLYKKLGMVSSYAIVFRAGENGIQTIGSGYRIEEKTSSIVDLNSFDFDKYIKTKNYTNIIKNNYCVYLDEYLPYHPDFEMLNIKTVDSTVFYNKLNKFFEFVENKFDVEVIIAAHPKAEKYKKNNPFNGRKIFYNMSPELIKDSIFSIAHCSTSVSFSVLNYKPIIFLTSNDIKNIMPAYDSLIKGFSEALDCCFTNIDNFKEESVVVNEVNNLKYDCYKYKYLTSKRSENRMSSEIFINAISQL